MKTANKNKKEKVKALEDRFRGTLARDSTQRHSPGDSKEVRTLSDPLCAQIASFYRRAIQNNKGDITSMIEAIHAIPHHLGANEENAAIIHRYCPKDIDSWCPYQFAIYSGQTLPKHPNYISENCVKMILTLYQFPARSDTFHSENSFWND